LGWFGRRFRAWRIRPERVMDAAMVNEMPQTNVTVKIRVPGLGTVGIGGSTRFQAVDL